MLLEAVTKHVLVHSEYPFRENNLELRAYINKGLKKQLVTIHKELHWVLQNWNDIMAFMMCGTHLDREVYTAGDLWDPVPNRIGRYSQPPQNKVKSSSRAAETSTKTTFTTESATEQVTLS